LYEKFLLLASKLKNENIKPPCDEIYAIWISHMLRPAFYDEYCQKKFKKIIVNKFSLDSLVVTNDIWNNEFGKTFDQDLLDELTENKYNSTLDYFPHNAFQDVVDDRTWFLDFSSFCNGMNLNFQKEIPKHIEKYKQFMWIIRKYPEKNFSPLITLDAIWHSHMINPKNYISDTKSFGFKLPPNHRPRPNASSENPRAMLKEQNLEFEKIWREEFKEEMEIDETRNDFSNKFPEEITIRVLIYLDLYSLLNVSEVNKFFQKLSRNDKIWKKQIQKTRDFAVITKENFLTEYKTHYKSRKEYNRNMSNVHCDVSPFCVRRIDQNYKITDK